MNVPGVDGSCPGCQRTVSVLLHCLAADMQIMKRARKASYYYKCVINVLKFSLFLFLLKYWKVPFLYCDHGAPFHCSVSDVFQFRSLGTHKCGPFQQGGCIIVCPSEGLSLDKSDWPDNKLKSFQSRGKKTHFGLFQQSSVFAVSTNVWVIVPN